MSTLKKDQYFSCRPNDLVTTCVHLKITIFLAVGLPDLETTCLHLKRNNVLAVGLPDLVTTCVHLKKCDGAGYINKSPKSIFMC